MILKNKKDHLSRIKFNGALLELNPQQYLDSIVAHECAHLIVYDVYGAKVKPHGKEWKGMMIGLFEADSSVRHNLDVSTLVNKPFVYNCQCINGIALSKRQHLSASKGSIYICKKCKSELSFSHEKTEGLILKA